jgi:hypothetical protein
MLRTIFVLGFFVILGLFALKVVFGIFGGLIGALIGLALKVALFGAIAYGVLSLVSPDTARRLRARWGE